MFILRFNDISAIIPAGVNVAYICTQVKASVDEEQSKALWIPRGGPWHKRGGPHKPQWKSI